MQAKLNRRATRRRLVRFGFLALNVGLLMVVALFVLGNRTADITSKSLLGNNDQTVSNPLDVLSSADIAVTVARLDNLTEIGGVTSQANSEHAELASATTSIDDVTDKPLVAASAFKSNKDIQTYVTQPGDTVASVATKFGITSDSVKWSNGLTATTLNAGTKLQIPPVSGIIYTIKSGDTPASLAATYKADAADIIASNDAELSGFSVGEQIIIPNGQQPVAPQTYVASFTAQYGNNGYDYGFCTWYIATQVAVPSNWGNASSWAFYARLSGWTVSPTPIVGAIAQTPYAAGGEGHVALVDAVSADGTQIQFKDMNGIAGWGRVGQSGWVSTSTFPNYIYH